MIKNDLVPKKIIIIKKKKKKKKENQVIFGKIRLLIKQLKFYTMPKKKSAERDVKFFSKKV